MNPLGITASERAEVERVIVQAASNEVAEGDLAGEAFVLLITALVLVFAIAAMALEVAQ